jgi:hypothetical protein
MLLLPVAFSGCASVTPQENFKDALYREIGKSVDNSLWAPRRYLISEKTMSNGNVEYRYQYLRSCRYMFEIEPKSRVIVNARFEGKEFDCVINP